MNCMDFFFIPTEVVIESFADGVHNGCGCGGDMLPQNKISVAHSLCNTLYIFLCCYFYNMPPSRMLVYRDDCASPSVMKAY